MVPIDLEAHHALAADRELVRGWELYGRTAPLSGGRHTYEDEHSLVIQVEETLREYEDPLVLAFVYGNVGVAALFTGDLDRARDALEEQLRLCREHVWPEVAGEGLTGVAAIAICGGDAQRGATLLGAASARGPIDDADVARQFEQRFFESARHVLGGSWSEAYADGAAMGFDEAVALALSEPMP